MTIDQTKDLQNRFKHHAPTPVAIKAHERVRALLYAVAYGLVALVPPGREQALMVTHLEEAMMWGNAGIARNHERLAEHLAAPSASALMSDGNPSSMLDWESAFDEVFRMDTFTARGPFIFLNNGDGTSRIATVDDVKSFLRMWLTPG